MVFEAIVPVLAAVAAGVTWTGFGYLSAWRKHRNDEDWQGFETKKLRNDIILGVILGIGVVISQAIQGITPPAIGSVADFVVATFGLFGLVAAVDKVIVGGILGVE